MISTGTLYFYDDKSQMRTDDRQLISDAFNVLNVYISICFSIFKSQEYVVRLKIILQEPQSS